MQDDPYHPPLASDVPAEMTRSRRRAEVSLRPPALSLLILSSIAMILDVAILLNAIGNDARTMLRDEGPEKGKELIVSNVVANGGMLVIHGFMLCGFVNMLLMN